MNYFSLIDFGIALTYILLPLILAAQHWKLWPQPSKKISLIFIYYLVISVGVQGIFTGLWQLFWPHIVANFLQYTYSPFILELGAANLAFGLLGMICPWMNLHWQAAAAVAYSIFLLLTALIHLMRIGTYGITPGDAGWFLASDIIVPFILLRLTYLTVAIKEQV